MRLIDAEPIIKNLSAMKTQLGYDAIDIDGMIKALREAEQVDVTPPPNNPLTLEQLREMDGEPVWVKSLDKDYGEWVIARTIELEGICLFTVVGATHQYGENGTMDGYGKTWLAYRRRPEENAA